MVGPAKFGIAFFVLSDQCHISATDVPDYRDWRDSAGTGPFILTDYVSGLLLLFSGIVMSVPLIVFSFSRSWGLSLAMMPFIGMGPTMHGALTGTLMQYYADPDYRGRMQSFTAMGSGLASIGTFLAGVMSDSIGIQWAVGSMAIFLSAVTIGFFVFSRRMRELE